MPLDREQVLGAALDLLDEVGLDGLSMRRLSAALAVQNGATYWHFPSKQSLLEAMADAMLAGVTDDLDAHASWDERTRTLAHRLRAALLARRDGARLFSGRFFPLPHALAYAEAMISALRAAGLAERDAVWTLDALTYNVVAHVQEEQMAAGAADDAGARLEAAVDPQRYPHLSAALEHVPAPHPEEHFDHGLDLILTGIHAGGPQPHERPDPGRARCRAPGAAGAG